MYFCVDTVQIQLLDFGSRGDGQLLENGQCKRKDKVYGSVTEIVPGAILGSDLYGGSTPNENVTWMQCLASYKISNF